MTINGKPYNPMFDMFYLARGNGKTNMRLQIYLAWVEEKLTGVEQHLTFGMMPIKLFNEEDNL